MGNADRDRIEAVRAFGFTERQARFLVLVLEHAGVWSDSSGINSDWLHRRSSGLSPNPEEQLSVQVARCGP
jgi:hypothetical protein